MSARDQLREAIASGELAPVTAAAPETPAGSELPPHHPPEHAASPEETAYEAFTARRGTQRIAWEALDAKERDDWRRVIRALAKRGAR